MNILVPLAGPDFLGLDGKLKGCELFQGEPMLKKILQTRPWADHVERYIFIFQDESECHQFYEEKLKKWFPSSMSIFLSAPTSGASLSALAGLSLISNFHSPLMVDLADIYFEPNSEFDVDKLIRVEYQNGAFTFQSDEPCYSYLKFSNDGKFLEAAEKKVISDRASSGVYYFVNAAAYCEAIAWHVIKGTDYCYKGLFYVCPLLNGLLKQGQLVTEVPVSNIIDLKSEK